MAQMAEKLPVSELFERDLTQVPARSIPPTGMPLNTEAADLPLALRLEEQPVGEAWLVENARTLGSACGHAQSYVSAITDRVRSKARDLVTDLEGRADKIKDEDTLQLLAVIAGIAAAAGVATRIWRSNRYE
jgi:hypothetical protein